MLADGFEQLADETFVADACDITGFVFDEDASSSSFSPAGSKVAAAEGEVADGSSVVASESVDAVAEEAMVVDETEEAIVADETEEPHEVNGSKKTGFRASVKKLIGRSR